MAKRTSVPEQKGKIVSNPMTMRQMPHNERLRERHRELQETRRGQTLEMEQPKR